MDEKKLSRHSCFGTITTFLSRLLVARGRGILVTLGLHIMRDWVNGALLVKTVSECSEHLDTRCRVRRFLAETKYSGDD